MSGSSELFYDSRELYYFVFSCLCRYFSDS